MSLEQDILTAEKRNEEGNLLYRNKRFDEACSQYSDAIVLLELHAQQTQEAHQHLCKYLSNRAAAYLASGYDAEAVKDCTSALAMDPMLDKALLRRGLGLESLGRHAESLQDVEALLKRADWGSPIATKGLELKRRLQRVLNQEKNSEEQPVPSHLFSKEQILRLNFRTLPPSEVSKERFFEISVYVANEFGLFSHREFSKSSQSDLACIEVSMIGDDPEVKLEVKNDNNLTLDTRGRATFDLRFVGSERMKIRSRATLCVRLKKGEGVMGRTVLTLMSLPITVLAEVGSITPFSTGLAGCMSGRGIDLPHLDSAVVILENPDSGIPGKIWDGGLILTEYLSSSSHEVLSQLFLVFHDACRSKENPAWSWEQEQELLALAAIALEPHVSPSRIFMSILS
uniref:Uncharacterized protein n=2 Tax=Guillardia theta TaxID=55529 RepID=A0A6U6BWJ0_GUITH|mmetsp:Transcript_41098/g.129114  ORF Transcript_41098/g.129114 Transcript_41098/m.129114 type:complete len:399 (+) Transcript_41098:263-1459(+)